MEALAHPWMPLAFAVMLFALFAYLLLFFSKIRQMAVFKGKEADTFLIAVILCICRSVEPVAALEPMQCHLWRRHPGALP